MTKKKVSVLIPFYNEQDVLPLLFERMNTFMDSMPSYDWEVLMTNDGSTDGSIDLVREKHSLDSRWRYIDLSRNYGKEVAMMAGLDNVTGDCVVIMDADLQHPPEVIAKMLSLWEGGADDVYGKRRSRGKEPWLRKQFSLLFYRILQSTTRIPVLQNAGDFRLLDRCCIDALCSMRETQRYTKGLYCWIGFTKAEVLFDQGDRVAGETKWNFFKLLGLAIEGITSYTTAPLRFATFVGMICSIISFMTMMYYLVKSLIWGDAVQGFPTLIVTLLLVGGLILFCLGVIGEYLGRVFMEVKGRPAYFVREIDGKTKRSSQAQIEK